MAVLRESFVRRIWAPPSSYGPTPVWHYVQAFEFPSPFGFPSLFERGYSYPFTLWVLYALSLVLPFLLGVLVVGILFPGLVFSVFLQFGIENFRSDFPSAWMMIVVAREDFSSCFIFSLFSLKIFIDSCTQRRFFKLLFYFSFSLKIFTEITPFMDSLTHSLTGLSMRLVWIRKA